MGIHQVYDEQGRGQTFVKQLGYCRTKEGITKMQQEDDLVFSGQLNAEKIRRIRDLQLCLQITLENQWSNKAYQSVSQLKQQITLGETSLEFGKDFKKRSYAIPCTKVCDDDNTTFYWDYFRLDRKQDYTEQYVLCYMLERSFQRLTIVFDCLRKNKNQ